jgi:hypothetical protein
MATIGQQLTAPETGWKRYDGSDSNIVCNPKWNARADQTSGCYNNTINGAIQSGTISFNFTGTKLRIIVLAWNLSSWMIESAPIFIDGVNMGTVKVASNTRVPQVLGFEIDSLSNKEHSVQISVPPDSGNSGKHAFPIDAVDIDENGEIKPYSPIISVIPDLIAAPGDAQITLNWDTITGATGFNVKRSTTLGGPYETIANVSGTSYVDTNVTNGTTYYYVVAAVNGDGEGVISNEASATPQAAPVEEGQGLLRVTMIDSSEREYKLPMREINGFIEWLNSHSNSDTFSYQLTTAFGSKEYLLFDKIISFEVISLPAE